MSPVPSTAGGTKEMLTKSIEVMHEQMPDHQALSTWGGTGDSREGRGQDPWHTCPEWEGMGAEMPLSGGLWMSERQSHHLSGPQGSQRA